MGYTLDDTGKPTLNDDATNPGPAGDFQAIVDYAEKVGGLLKITAAERAGLVPGDVNAGWIISETDTKRLYLVTDAQPQGVLLMGADVLTTFRTNTPVTGVVSPIMMTGVATGTTTAGGVLIHSFPTPFPTACLGVMLMQDNESGADGDGNPTLVRAEVKKTGFQTFWPRRGTAAVTISYIAFGY